MRCFPRNFVEDKLELCKHIILDIKDILESDIIYTNMRTLYKYVLFHIITDEIEFINETEESSFAETFSPLSVELGYMNIHVKLGITITINKNRRLADVIEAMSNYVESEKENLHILQIHKEREYMLHTIVDNLQDNTVINCYHFVLHLNGEEFERYADEVRKMLTVGEQMYSM